MCVDIFELEAHATFYLRISQLVMHVIRSISADFTLLVTFHILI